MKEKVITKEKLISKLRSKLNRRGGGWFYSKKQDLFLESPDNHQRSNDWGKQRVIGCHYYGDSILVYLGNCDGEMSAYNKTSPTEELMTANKIGIHRFSKDAVQKIYDNI